MCIDDCIRFRGDDTAATRASVARKGQRYGKRREKGEGKEATFHIGSPIAPQQKGASRILSRRAREAEAILRE